MSTAVTVEPAPAVVPKERGRKKHHKHHKHHHHHHRHHKPDDNWNCLCWGMIILLFLILIGWMVASFFVYPYYPYPPIIVEDPDRFNHSVFVFKYQKQHFTRGKRSKSTCKTGETWDNQVGMCAPIFNTPTAFDSSIMNTAVGPCNSFFGSMCGKWNAEHVNEDRTFSYGYYKNERLLKTIITQADTDSGISKFYTSCVGVGDVTNTRESDIELKHLFESIAGDLNTYGDLPVVFGRLARHGYTAPFVFSIERHPTEPRMIPYISWDGFPGADEHLISSVFERASGMFSSSVKLNKMTRALKVARAINLKNTEPVDEVNDYFDYVKHYFQFDVVKYDQLPAWNMKPINTTKGWNMYFQALDGLGLRFDPKQTIWVVGLPYLQWLLQEALYQFDLNDWRAYVQFSILYHGHQFNPALPDNVYFRKWDVVGPVGRGRRIYHRIPRSSLRVPSADTCISITQHMIPGLVAEEYLKVMPQKEETRAEVKNMTKRILEVYATLVQSSSWLSVEGKEIALKKIRNIVIRVAEPDEWISEPFAARLSADRYDHNMNIIRRYRVHRNLQLWHKDKALDIDRNALSFFAGPLSDVNAYYSGPTNTITVLAGILQPPFYLMSYNNVSKYAILGSIIGHELGHALDFHGLYFDEDGSLKLNSIWSPTDFNTFIQKTRAVEREFAIKAGECPSVEDGFNYGNITLNEDLSDLIGIKLAYRSYFDNNKNAPLGDKQHFFMIFAQVWCSSYTKEEKCQDLSGDPHAFPEYRVDRTLRNIPEFHNVFACSGTNPMYNNPNDVIMVY